MKRNIVTIVAIAILLLTMISSTVGEELLGPTISLDFDTTNNTVIFFFYNPNDNDNTTMKGRFMMTIQDQREIIEFSAGPNENFRSEMKPKTSGTVHLQGWYKVNNDRYQVTLTREIFLQEIPAVNDYNQESPETGRKIPWFGIFIGMIVFAIAFGIAGTVIKRKK